MSEAESVSEGEAPEATALSPLAEPELTSLDELFSRDPFSYSKQDLSIITANLRAQRKNWQMAEAQGKRSAPKAGAKAKPPAAPKIKGPELSMEDILDV